MERRYYKDEPKPYETVRCVGTYITVVRMDITEIVGSEEYSWQADEVEVAHREPLTSEDYPRIVSTIVRGKYSQDDVEALTQNYIVNPTKYGDDWEALQLWRNKAKAVAKEVVS